MTAARFCLATALLGAAQPVRADEACRPVTEAATVVLCAGQPAPWSGYLVADGPLTRTTAAAVAARAPEGPPAPSPGGPAWPTWVVFVAAGVGVAAGAGAAVLIVRETRP